MKRNEPAATPPLPPPECPQAEKAAAWAADSLDPASERVYLRHLTYCPYCSAELQRFRAVVERLRDVPPEQPSPDLTDRIMASLPEDAFRVTPFTRLLSFLRRRRTPLAATAAAALAAALLGAWVGMAHDRTDPGRATRAGCDWIARQQEQDGSWDPRRNGGAAQYRPALTALASLALLRDYDRHAREIANASRALVRTQEPDGAFGADNTGRMYNHAFATWALLAVYERGHAPDLKAPLDRALAFIRNHQQADGGWGYSTSLNEPANTAVTAWQVQILGRALQTGWDDAGGHLRRGLVWLRQRADARGHFGYTAGPADASATPTLDAMGAYTLLTAGRSRPELTQTAATAIARLKLDAADASARDADFYRAFFTAAAWDAAGDAHRAALVRREICGRRERRGADQGSWAPADDWGKVGGRLYATSLAVLTLRPSTAAN